jgi:hypothetical protein
MTPALLADLAHLFFLEASLAKTNREMRYYMKCSRSLAERAIKEGNRGQ